MEKKKWYDRKVLVIILLLLFFPLGILGLIKSRTIKTFTKIVLLALVIGLIAYVVVTDDEANKLANESLDELNSETTSYELVGEVKDFSYSNVKRISATIRIPIGRTEREVENTFARAVKDLAEKHDFQALSVNAFAVGDKIKKGSYTVGQAIFAPNGKWEDADKTATKKLSIILGSTYFSEKETIYKIGQTIRADARDNNNIKLSDQWDIWEDDHIIATVSDGTVGKILEIKEENLTADYVLTRLKVDFNGSVGWVHAHDVE